MSLHNHFYPAINYCLYYNYIYAISPKHNSGHKVCGGPGWRHVAFISMTDMYQLQLPYIAWTQFDSIFQEDLWTVTHNLRRMFFNHI